MSAYTFSTCTATVNVIAALDPQPNDVGGLTAAQLQAKFDQAGTDIKNYINNNLIPAIQTNYATTSAITETTTDIFNNAQTFTGTITFIKSPIMPTPSGATDGANKGYVDTHIADTTTHGTTGDIVGTTDSQTLINKAIDADNNAISNLEVDNLKAGVLDTDLTSTSANDDTIPSAKATKTYADSVGTAQSALLDTHKTSTDHDSRYYTETETDALLSTRDSNLNTHKSSTDHDSRYYTESEIGSTTDGSSGGSLVGMPTLTGLSGNNVESQMESMKSLVDAIVAGEVGDFNTPTYSTETTSTTEILSIPSTAVEGAMSTALVGGNVVTNLLTDAVAGCESTTGWGSANKMTIATDSSNEIEGTNCLKVTLTDNTTGAYIIKQITSTIEAGKYYFLSAFVKNGNLDNGIKFGFFTIGDQTRQSSFITSTSYNRVGVVIQPTDFDTASNSYLIISGSGSNTQYGYIDAIMLQEITSAEYALGATALLDKYSFHLGTKGTGLTRVNSVGKNILTSDINYWEQGSISTLGGSNSTNTTRIRTKYYHKIDRGSAISTSCASGFDVYYKYFYDKNYNFISYTTTDNNITVPSNAEYYRLIVRYTNDATITIANLEDAKVQVEYNSTSTTYEPYQSISAFTPATLNAVPNGTADTYDCLTGKHIKRIALDSDVSSTQYDSLDKSTYTNVDVIKTTAFSTAVAGTTGVDGYTVVLNSDGTARSEVAQANIDEVASVGKYYYHTDKTVWYIVAADTYADIAAARTGLGTTQVYCQLLPSSYVETDHLPKPIDANPSGTVYIEPFEEFYDFYSSGLDANVNTIASVNDIEYVDKYDTNTGAVTSIPLSSVTVTSGAISAISGATAGELYVVGFRYNYASTIADFTYKYNTNLKAQVSSNTDSIRNLDSKVDNVDTRVQANEDRLSTNETNIATNVSNIATNSASIISLNAGLTATYYKTHVSSARTDSITASSTVSITIATGGTYSNGMAVMYATGTPKYSCTAFFGTTTTYTKVIGGYISSAVNDVSSWTRASNGCVTDYYNASGSLGSFVVNDGGTETTNLRILDMFINGTNIELIVQNKNATTSYSLEMTVAAELWN